MQNIQSSAADVLPKGLQGCRLSTCVSGPWVSHQTRLFPCAVFPFDLQKRRLHYASGPGRGHSSPCFLLSYLCFRILTEWRSPECALSLSVAIIFELSAVMVIVYATARWATLGHAMLPDMCLVCRPGWESLMRPSTQLSAATQLPCSTCHSRICACSLQPRGMEDGLYYYRTLG